MPSLLKSSILLFFPENHIIYNHGLRLLSVSHGIKVWFSRHLFGSQISFSLMQYTKVKDRSTECKTKCKWTIGVILHLRDLQYTAMYLVYTAKTYQKHKCRHLYRWVSNFLHLQQGNEPNQKMNRYAKKQTETIQYSIVYSIV